MTCPIHKTSIAKKQFAATTSLLLVLFIIGHMAGNLLIYGGAELYNSYAEHLAGLRPALYVVELALLVAFLGHAVMTLKVVMENRAATGGGKRYAVEASKGNRSLATRIMPYTGTILFLFVIYHLKDFTFSSHEGARSMLADGQSYGLYGVVWNAFLDPVHSALYIVAMACVGFHLSHGIQSVFQTYGFLSPARVPALKKISRGIGIFVGAAFASIPVYVLLSQGMK